MIYENDLTTMAESSTKKLTRAFYLVQPSLESKAKTKIVTSDQIRVQDIVGLKIVGPKLTTSALTEAKYYNLLKMSPPPPDYMMNSWPPEIRRPSDVTHMIEAAEFENPVGELLVLKQETVNQRISKISTPSGKTWTEQQNALMKAVVVEAVSIVEGKLETIRSEIDNEGHGLKPIADKVNAIHSTLVEGVIHLDPEQKPPPAIESLVQAAAAAGASKAVDTVVDKAVNAASDLVFGSDTVKPKDIKEAAAQIVVQLYNDHHEIMSFTKDLDETMSQIKDTMPLRAQADNLLMTIITHMPHDDPLNQHSILPNALQLEQLNRTSAELHALLKSIVPSNEQLRPCAPTKPQEGAEEDQQREPIASRFGELIDDTTEDVDEGENGSQVISGRLPSKCDLQQLILQTASNTELLHEIAVTSAQLLDTVKRVEVHLSNITMCLKIRPILPLIGPLNFQC